MSLKIEPLGIADRVLAWFGKRRAVYIPSCPERFGYYYAPRERFFRALLRPKTEQPPKGWCYLEQDGPGI
jgi:hypothetical protein